LSAISLVFVFVLFGPKYIAQPVLGELWQLLMSERGRACARRDGNNRTNAERKE
jgi:hypothetical protein